MFLLLWSLLYNKNFLQLLHNKRVGWGFYCLTQTSSMYSGSVTEASHLLWRMKMFGLEILSLTLWKKSFSCRQKTTDIRNIVLLPGQKFKFLSSPCSSESTLHFPPGRRHQHPDRTYRSSCPAPESRQSQGWVKGQNQIRLF